MARVLLLLPTSTYRAPDFLEAASRLAVDVTVASERDSTVADFHPAGFLTLDFRDPDECARRAVEFARSHPIAAAIAVDEDTAVVAAAIGRALGLPHNAPDAARAARHKPTFRARLAASGVPSPSWRVFPLATDPREAARLVSYPCVLKPTFLSGSRGVIRADGAGEFVAAWERVRAILREPRVAERGGPDAGELLVEDFVPGREVALEGLLRSGALEVLALFDKPDPLDGPFFEETLYVTPSRLAGADQREIARTTERAAAALGLTEGALHAEIRWNPAGAWPVDIAARSIGGLCSRALRFGAGLSLEEIILRHALGEESPPREAVASGVLMIPVPGTGVLRAVEGVEDARATPGVGEVTITARIGERLVPLPEGSRYPGFLFARGQTPEAVEAALRQAHGSLRFQLD